MHWAKKTEHVLASSDMLIVQLPSLSWYLSHKISTVSEIHKTCRCPGEWSTEGYSLHDTGKANVRPEEDRGTVIIWLRLRLRRIGLRKELEALGVVDSTNCRQLRHAEMAAPVGVVILKNILEAYRWAKEDWWARWRQCRDIYGLAGAYDDVTFGRKSAQNKSKQCQNMSLKVAP